MEPFPTFTPSPEPSETFTPDPSQTVTPTPDPSEEPAEGDLNGDGGVNVLDVQLCVNVFLGVESNPLIVARSDVNQDGQVDVLDVQVIANLVLSG